MSKETHTLSELSLTLRKRANNKHMTYYVEERQFPWLVPLKNDIQ